MVPGMMIRSLRGTEGKVSVPGLGAVIATFQTWNLERREENDSGNPNWTLHAVLSYSNASLMKNEAIDKHFTLILNKEKKIEICAYESMKLEGISLLVEGVVQCP